MSGKKIKNKEHNMTNPYDFDKLEYEKGYKGCAKSGSGIPIVNKFFGGRLCDLGIGTKEYENNRNRDWLKEALNDGSTKLPENQPKPTSNAEPTPNNETNKKGTGDTGTSGDNNTGNGNDGGNSNGENTGNAGNKPGDTGNTGVGGNTGSEGSGNTGNSENNGDNDTGSGNTGDSGTGGYKCSNSMSWGGGTECQWFDLINKYFFDEYDPLVLDLNGDSKISTINRNDSNSYFNHDGDNIKYRTSWIGKEDGILVIDKNGNGTIDNGSELFGNFTTKIMEIWQIMALRR